MTSAIGGGDISHDGRRIALLQSSDGQLALMVVTRDGSRAERVTLVAAGSVCIAALVAGCPLIAFQAPVDGSTSFSRSLGDGGLRSDSPHVNGLTGYLAARGSGSLHSSRGCTLLYPRYLTTHVTRRWNRSPFTFAIIRMTPTPSAGKLLAVDQSRLTSGSFRGLIPADNPPRRRLAFNRPRD